MEPINSRSISHSLNRSSNQGKVVESENGNEESFGER